MMLKSGIQEMIKVDNFYERRWQGKDFILVRWLCICKFFRVNGCLNVNELKRRM